MKIVVTGGCGFIGSHTVVDLIQHGFEPVILDDNSRSSAAVLDGVEKITGVRPIHYPINICDRKKVFEVFEKHTDIRGIIHFAAYKYVDESVANPLLYFDNNLNGQLNLLEAVKAFKTSYFVFSSSCSVYGNIDQLPVSENTPLHEAQSPYARTKQMGEQIIEDFSKSVSSKFISLRYFNPVGAHESSIIGESSTVIPSNIIPRITGSVLGKFSSFSVYGTDYPTRDGSCIRDYIHVMDIAEAHTLALKKLIQNPPISTHEIYNLGSGNGVSVLEAIKAFEEVSGKKVPVVYAPRREGDVIAVYADNSKATKELNWKPSRDIYTMMRDSWNWAKK